MSHQSHKKNSHVSLRAAVSALAIVMVLIFAATPVQAQTFTVLHSFTGGGDGANPVAGLTLDRAGNLYGTAAQGGNTPYTCGSTRGCGTVFKIARAGAGWITTPLYKFNGGDGLSPLGRVSFGPDGTLYGTTYAGQGYSCSCGNVFNLKPPARRPATPLAPWDETVIHQFSPEYGEGTSPRGDLAFDAAGNIYGTTFTGGNWNLCSGGVGCGTVYELTRSGGSWTENVLYAFNEAAYYPESGVILDASGTLYGTATQGNFYYGAVFELTPSGSGWTESTLHNFPDGSGVVPVAGLVFDGAGNLYGATVATTANGGGGTVFQLTPSGGGWSFDNLYTLTGGGSGRTGPQGNLLVDAAGNLYGTTSSEGAYGKGTVFKLTPGIGGWTYTSVHDFTGGSDGANPMDGLVMDPNGNLYGTAYAGGTTGAHCDASVRYQCGVAFEITL